MNDIDMNKVAEKAKEEVAQTIFDTVVSNLKSLYWEKERAEKVLAEVQKRIDEFMASPDTAPTSFRCEPHLPKKFNDSLFYKENI